MTVDGSNLVGLTWRRNKTSSCTLNQTIVSAFGSRLENAVALMVEFKSKYGHSDIILLFVGRKHVV
jgi:hypothetical protein